MQLKNTFLALAVFFPSSLVCLIVVGWSFIVIALALSKPYRSLGEELWFSIYYCKADPPKKKYGGLPFTIVDPTLPADSFLGGSSVPFGCLKRLRSGSTQLANALLWPPPVPADSFLGGSSVPFGRLKRLRSGSTQLANVLLWPPPVPADSFLGARCCGHHLCRQTLFLGVQVCLLAGLKGCAAAPHSLQTRCCGHRLCRQTLFLGVQVCRLAALKLRSGPTQLANALLWPPPVPADSFLGGSSVPFGGVGGTRALAHSIYIYIYIYIVGLVTVVYAFLCTDASNLKPGKQVQDSPLTAHHLSKITQYLYDIVHNYVHYFTLWQIDMAGCKLHTNCRQFPASQVTLLEGTHFIYLNVMS